ncbi:hypothetical protein [Actinoplanes sp. NPDC051859]|uniref:hypothetical protein n=1 Tax=Actinoplanes sp. NPDC051859 TaxID=3363909 RepID=UPI0037933AA5
MLSRLRIAEWHSWPAVQVAAVRHVLAALWESVLVDGEREPDTVLCGLGNAEGDLQPYLDAWAAALTRPATRLTAAMQLRDLLQHGCELRKGRRRLTNSFWAERATQAEQVLTWLFSPELQVIVFAAVDSADDEETLQVLADLDEAWRAGVS